MFQSINVIFIVALAPLFSMMWVALSKVNLNPRTPFKFAWGMLLLSIGAAVMEVADIISKWRRHSQTGFTSMVDRCLSDLHTWRVVYLAYRVVDDH